MKNYINKILILITLPLLTHCGPKPEVSTLKNVDTLENYKTFAYLPNTDFDVSSPNSGNNGAVTRSVVAAMNRNMQTAGYWLDRENPDLLVVLNARYDPEMEKGCGNGLCQSGKTGWCRSDYHLL